MGAAESDCDSEFLRGRPPASGDPGLAPGPRRTTMYYSPSKEAPSRLKRVANSKILDRVVLAAIFANAILLARAGAWKRRRSREKRPSPRLTRGAAGPLRARGVAGGVEGSARGGGCRPDGVDRRGRVPCPPASPRRNALRPQALTAAEPDEPKFGSWSFNVDLGLLAPRPMPPRARSDRAAAQASLPFFSSRRRSRSRPGAGSTSTTPGTSSTRVPPARPPTPPRREAPPPAAGGRCHRGLLLADLGEGKGHGPFPST